MKKLAVWLIAAAFALSMALPQYTALAKETGQPALFVDGVEMEGFKQLFTSQGQMLVLADSLFSAAGFNVSKGEDGKATTATNGYLTVVFNPSAKSVTVNGEKADLEFPLTLQNGGNYIPVTFLNELAGFDAVVSEDGQKVEVSTNRVKNVDAFLEKLVAAELNSYSATMDIEQTMQANEFGTMSMKMKLAMDAIQDPLSMHMVTEMEMVMDEDKISTSSEAYMTEEGLFQNDGEGWFKFDENLIEDILGSTAAQADPLAQLEMMKEFISSLNVFEYEDQYVMTYTVSDEDFEKLLSSILGDFAGMLEGSLPAIEEDGEAVEEGEVSEELEDAVSEEDLEEILGSMSMKIEEFYAITTIDKKTLFPVDTSSKMKMVMTMDEEEIVTNQVMTGKYSNFNSVKPITIPEEVIKNAKSFDEYLKEMEETLETETE